METKKAEIARLRKIYSYSSFYNSVFFEMETLKFKTSENRLSIISEIKKASPSKGIINKNFNHLEIANRYLLQKPEAISVLTDVTYFSGSISYLEDIAAIKTVPLLRKDFIIDEIQVLESRAKGADMILLICEALSALQIRDLTQTANEAGLQVLLELHSLDQLDKIDFARNKIIGVNNRNLEDFSVSLDATKKLCSLLPNDCTIISESGISNKEDIDVIKATKASGILIGEILMRSKNPEQELLQIKEWCIREN